MKSNIIESDSNRGYIVCDTCNAGVILHKAGFEVETHVCATCRREVADKDDFFMRTGVKVLGK